MEDRLHLHVGEVQADAFVRAAAEGHPGIGVHLVFAAVLGEPLRIKALRVRPVLFHIVGEVGRHGDKAALGNMEAVVFHVTHGAAGQRRHRRAQAQRFLHGQADARQLFQVLVFQLGFAQRAAFLAQALLPFRRAGQVVEQIGQGDGGGVVGRHHQEDHVVDHIVVGEAVAVLGGGMAKRAEQVVVLLGPFRRDLIAEQLLQHPPAAQPLGPAQPRHREAQQRGAGAHRVHERPVDLFGARAQFLAHEHIGGQVQGQPLDPGQHLDAALRPGVQAGGDARPHALQIAAERVFGERLLHDAPVPAVLLEIQQHDAAMEKRADEKVPAAVVGEQVALVHQHELVGVRAQHLHHPQAEQPGPGHRTVLVVTLSHQAHWITHTGQSVPDQWPARISGDRLEGAAGGNRRKGGNGAHGSLRGKHGVYLY